MRIDFRCRPAFEKSEIKKALTEGLPKIVATSYNHLSGFEGPPALHESGVRVWVSPFPTDDVSGYDFRILLLAEMSPRHVEILRQWRATITDGVREIVFKYTVPIGKAPHPKGLVQVVVGEESSEVV